MNTDFIVQSDNTLRYTCIKNDQYCVEKQVKGKKTFVPLIPQPYQDSLVTLTRYYTPLKRQNNFKKRVSTFNRMPQRFSDRANLALVEYTGSFPTASAPHGNAKNVTYDYVRTNPDVMARIKEGIDNKQSNIDIYKTMVLKDPENAPRDHQQIRSKRYHDKQKDKHTVAF